MKNIIIRIIKLYQRCKPYKFRGNCIYQPTCSNYSVEAIKKYGAYKGLILTMKRLNRCNSSHDGGIDYLD